jgi:hypothetical protein
MFCVYAVPVDKIWAYIPRNFFMLPAIVKDKIRKDEMRRRHSRNEERKLPLGIFRHK